MVKQNCECINLGHGAAGEGHPVLPCPLGSCLGPGLYLGLCHLPGCWEVAIGGHGHSGTFARAGYACVQAVPAPRAPSTPSSASSSSERAELPTQGWAQQCALCRVCCSSSAFSLQTSWTSGPGLVPSLAAVSPGDEGTGRTCQAPAQTGLCSSSLQPRIRRAAQQRDMDSQTGEWGLFPLTGKRWDAHGRRGALMTFLPSVPELGSGLTADVALPEQRCSEPSPRRGHLCSQVPGQGFVPRRARGRAWARRRHLPRAVGVGTGQFRQPADSGRLLHHVPASPQLLP